jgi:hypothetical protein
MSEWASGDGFSVVRREVRCWWCGQQWQAPSDDVIEDDDHSWLCADKHAEACDARGQRERAPGGRP